MLRTTATDRPGSDGSPSPHGRMVPARELHHEVQKESGDQVRVKQGGGANRQPPKAGQVPGELREAWPGWAARRKPFVWALRSLSVKRRVRRR